MIAAARRADLLFLLPVAVLLATGIGMVYSSSFVVAQNEFGNGAYFLIRHAIFVAIGLVGLAVVARLDYHRLQGVAFPFYVVSLILLGIVLIPGLGTASYGASRWLTLGPLPTLQPSELAKLAVVIYLATWIARVGGDIHRLTFGTIPFAIILSLSAVLVLRGPDLGTTVVLVLTAASVFFMAGANLLHALLGVVLCCVILFNVVLSSGYKVDRIQAFLNPWADPSGVGWHTTQALIALGSGGFSGLGLGDSRQKYYYVPNAHTDSIFAIIGEEIGFIGTLMVVAMFLLIAWRGLTIAMVARDVLGRALAAGATLLIVWQGLINMAVVSHLVPNTGVPLPLVSYGGNATIVSLVAVGLVLSVSRTIPREELGVRRLVENLIGGFRFERVPVRDLPAHTLSTRSATKHTARREGARRSLRRAPAPSGRG
jgi:cell division protein FtsW